MRKLKRFIIDIAYFLIGWFCRLISLFVPTDEHIILFLAFHGRGYTDSPKYIHQYMAEHLDEYGKYQCIWALNDTSVTIPNAKVVKYNSFSYFYYLAKAKYWFVNCKMKNFIYKKKDQIYLQTWHGTPLKRLGRDIQADENMTFYRSQMSVEQMKHSYDYDASRYDYMVSPNPFSTKVFPSAFGVDPKKMIETGYPRNDFLANLTNEQIQELKVKYQIPSDKKVILYAPTWRDNAYNAKGYVFELKANFKKWKEQLQDEYVVIFKPHYLIVNTVDTSNMEGFLYRIDANADINELYAISDLLITDYSSVFFDYAILNRPMLFYMYDRQEYADVLRGFYFDVDEVLPGKIVEDEDELLNEIRHLHDTSAQVKAFNEEFNAFSDGYSSKKILDIVLKK